MVQFASPPGFLSVIACFNTQQSLVAGRVKYGLVMRPRIMYIECKAGGLNGPARIGRVTFSKAGRTLYYRGQSFQSLKGVITTLRCFFACPKHFEYDGDISTTMVPASRRTTTKWKAANITGFQDRGTMVRTVSTPAIFQWKLMMTFVRNTGQRFARNLIATVIYG
jgi:hypothetical protein